MAIFDDYPSVAGQSYISVLFTRQSNAGDKWLRVGTSGISSSDEIPWICPLNMKLVIATYSNHVVADMDFQIYLNGTLADNFLVIQEKSGVHVDLTPTSFVPGDEVSIYCDSLAGSPNDLVVFLYFILI